MRQLEHNLVVVRQRIVDAALRAGRDPEEVTLVAVTKTQPPDVILAAYQLGVRYFGENRVEEAEGKAGALPSDAAWHMIGHIQSRKAKRVLPLFGLVHSVDSTRLASRLDRLCEAQGARLRVLLELNVSGEESKYGFGAADWFSDGSARRSLLSALDQIASLPHLEVVGLMTMAPIVPDPEAARTIFRHLRRIRDDLRDSIPQVSWDHLSMGMTDDFEVAIEEGATLVRVGRAIFAPDVPSWRKD
ncbi:YggS family pyridoxal phosphate-dependent enzyme [Chloroflexota bacterium]